MGVVTLQAAGSSAAAVTIPDGTMDIQVRGCYDVGFLQRLAGAAMVIALAILQEDPATELHAQRAAYARVVVADPVAVTNRSLCWAVVVDGIINPLSLDQDLANRLGDVWNHLSTGYS